MTSETKERYQVWELQGNGRYQFLWPIPQDHQPDQYIEVVYNAQGGVSAIHEWTEGTTKPLLREPSFDVNHRLIRSVYHDPGEGRRGINNYEYDERGFLCARFETDPQHHLRFRVEMRCDAKGRLIEEKLFDHRMCLKSRHVYEYGAGNHLVTKESVFGGKQGQTLEGTITRSYDPQGRLIRQCWHHPDGSEKKSFSYRYDDQHYRIEMSIEEGGIKTVTSRFVRNEHGKKIETIFLDAQEGVLGREVHTSEGTTKQDSSFVPPTPDSNLKQSLLRGEQKLTDLAHLSPKELQALTTVAYSHFENNRYKEALQLFDMLAMLDPDNVYYKHGAGACALQLGQAQTAFNWYERALGVQTDHIPSLVGKGEALLHLKKVDQALALFEQVFAKNPASTDPAVQRAKQIVMAIVQQT